MTLADIRSKIDALDEKILHLLADRVSLARQARSLKAHAHDPAREQEVRACWNRHAEELGLNGERTDAVLNAVIDLTRSAQEP